MKNDTAAKLPPLIRTSDPDSFAAFTFRTRLPELLDQIILSNRLEGSQAAGLKRLKARLDSGTVDNCLTAHPYLCDQMGSEAYEVWAREIKRHLGKSWRDLPWYFAESLFFFEVLLGWGYYRPGSLRFRTDPYMPFKEEEMHRPGGALDLSERILSEVTEADCPRSRLMLLLRYCLWANRLDLSYRQVFEKYRNREESVAERLLVNHSDSVVEALLKAQRVDLVLDNCASELMGDLNLARYLLHDSAHRSVVLHCKAEPFYVSDATAPDVENTVRSLKQSERQTLRDLGRFLSESLKGGSLRLQRHHFWNGPLMFSDLPSDLRRELSESDLVLLKGDLNYRRLLGDRHWPPTTDMDSIVRYFPAPLAVLRTTKSDLTVDLRRETVRTLNREDPSWQIEGGYGIIRYCDSRS